MTGLRTRVLEAEAANAELTHSNKQLRGNLEKAGQQIKEAQALQDRLETTLQCVSNEKVDATQDAEDTGARCALLQVRQPQCFCWAG